MNISGEVSLLPGSLIVKDKGLLVEESSVVIELSNVSLKLAVQLGIDSARLRKLQVGNVIDFQLPCFASTLADLNFTLLDVDFTIEQNPYVVGFAGVSPLFNELIDSLFSFYGTWVSSAIRGIGDDEIRSSLNDLLFSYLSSLKHKGCQEIPLSSDQMLSFF